MIPHDEKRAESERQKRDYNDHGDNGGYERVPSTAARGRSRKGSLFEQAEPHG